MNRLRQTWLPQPKAREAEATLRKWYKLAVGAAPGGEPSPAAIAALADDLNTHGVLTELHRLASTDDARTLRATLEMVGLIGDAIPQWAEETGASDVVAALIEDLLKDRAQARKAKDFTRADALRDGFAAAGVLVKDTADGATWELSPDFDPSKLEALK